MRNDMGTGEWLAAMCLVLATGCRTADVPAPSKPAMGIRELMQSVLNPNAGVVWRAVSTVVTTAGIEERQPRSNDEWTKVRNAAASIVKGGNQLLLSRRASDGSRWKRAAQTLIETSTAAVRAAEARNADQLFAVGGEMYSACLSCHENYMSE
jgi:hypothetical protein